MTSFVRTGSNKSKGHPLKVIIVDDHDLFRRGLSDLLNTIKGLKVVGEAASSEEALLLVDTIHADLVFLDLSLSDGNALPIIQTLRGRATTLSIIVLSATQTDDTLLQAMLAGASGYLTKDLPAPEIASLLHQFLNGELALSAQTASRLIQVLIDKHQELEAALHAQISEPHAVSAVDSSSRLTAMAASPEVEPAHSPPLLDLLTSQEEKIYQLMKRGLTNKEIAKELAISHFTVGKHVQNILHKLKVLNRTQAVSYTAFEGGTFR
jgi:DNA-binding NarL/FixJ family response regulator